MNTVQLDFSSSLNYGLMPSTKRYTEIVEGESLKLECVDYIHSGDGLAHI